MRNGFLILFMVHRHLSQALFIICVRADPSNLVVFLPDQYLCLQDLVLLHYLLITVLLGMCA